MADITSAQFSRGSANIEICATKVNAKVPSGSIGYSKRGKSTSSTPPKICGAARVIDMLLKQKNIAAMYHEGTAYAEISYPGGTNAYLYDGSRLFKKIETTEKRYEDLSAFVMMAINYEVDSSFEETQSSFRMLKAEHDSGAVTLATLGLFCDCFYYESKESIGSYTEDVLSAAKLQEVQQAIRTDSMKLANRLCPVSSAFKHVDASSLMNPPSPGKSTPVPKDFIGKCLDEEYLLGHNWREDQQNRIPNIDKLREYVPTKEHYRLTKVVSRRLSAVLSRMMEGASGLDAIGNDFVNVILVGKPGTGKTVTGEAVAAALGMPLYTVPCSKNIEEDTFEGKTKAAEGTFRFFPTPFLEAFENGGVVILEEFNLADAGVMQGALGQAIVPPFLLLKDGIKEVYRHPLCVVMMTMNTATQGSRLPNEAFITRAPLTYLMDDPPEELFIEILAKKGYPKRNCKRIYKTYQKIINYITENAPGCDDYLLALAIRHCIEALDYMQDVSFKDAIHDTMIGALAIKDLQLANTVYKSLIETMPDAA